MKYRGAIFLMILLTLSVGLPSTAPAQEKRTLTLGIKTVDWPPYLIPGDPERPGLVIEICRAISRRLGTSLHLRQLPDQRGLRHLSEGEIDA